MIGPEKKSDWEYAGDPDTTTWHDWKEHKLADKSSGDFEYKDGTEENINEGESQHFHYEGNDLPEKE